MEAKISKICIKNELILLDPLQTYASIFDLLQAYASPFSTNCKLMVPADAEYHATYPHYGLKIDILLQTYASTSCKIMGKVTIEHFSQLI